MAPDPAHTIDELAAAVGAPTRTVRYWQSLGLVPPPERVGRVARYGEVHLRRARLVTTLSSRGVRLEAMPRLIELLEHGGDSLREWLGLGAGEITGADRAVAEDRQVRLPANELVRRFGGRNDVLKGLRRMHVARPDGEDGAWVVPSDGLLELALRIDRLGVDVETAVGAEAILRHHLRALAEDIVAWFETCLPPPESTRAAWARLGALRPIGADAVRLLFWQELTRAFRRRAQRPRAPEPPALPSWLRWVLGRRIPFPPSPSVPADHAPPSAGLDGGRAPNAPASR